MKQIKHVDSVLSKERAVWQHLTNFTRATIMKVRFIKNQNHNEQEMPEVQKSHETKDISKAKKVLRRMRVRVKKAPGKGKILGKKQ